MNVGHTKLYIPIEYDGKKYHITVEIENKGEDFPTYIATGPGFVNLAESLAGFGMCPMEAIEDLFTQYEGHRIYLQNHNL